MGHITATVLSAALFAGGFLAFSLSLDFWGRLVLKALGAGDAAEPDSLLGCLAGASVLFVASRWCSAFTHAFELPFAVFLGLGALGAVLDIAKETRRARDPSRREGARGPWSPVAAREWAVVSALLAFALGVWFCRLWPSGTMEPFLVPSADLYSWVFHAGYWMGYTEAATYGITYHHPWIFDGFGTNILFASFSSARGEPAWLAAPAFSMLLMAWTGLGVYGLVRRAAGFPRWLSWLSALGVSCGWFFWLLSFYGAYGHLAAVPGYLAAVRAVLEGRRSPPSPRSGFLGLFFPLLYLFMCYQAGYLMFAALCAGIGFLKMSFGWSGRGGEPEAGGRAGTAAAAGGGDAEGARHVRNGSSALLLRVLGHVWKAAWPVAAATALAAAVSPQVAAQVVGRTVSAAVQKDGYGLNFLDPGLFAGFPLIADGGPFGTKPGVPWLWWAAFLAALAVLCAVSLRRGVKVFPERDLAGLKALSLVFALLLGAYLAAFAWKGDDYRVWKLVGLTALPLSFLPAALLVTSIHEAFRKSARAAWAVCALSAALIAVPHAGYRNASGPRAAVDDVKSLLPLAEVVGDVLRYDRDKDIVLFDFMSLDRNFAAMVISQYSGIARVGFLNGTYFGGFVEDYLKFAERGVPVYSDRSYPGLFKGRAVSSPPDFTVYRYDMNLFRRGGAVAFTSLERYTMRPDRRAVRIKLLPPEELVGHDLLVRITFAAGSDGTDPSCAGVTAREANAPLGEAVLREGSEFLIRAPAEWQHGGYISLLLDFADLPPVPRSDGMAWDRKNPPVCRYGFEAVEIFPDTAGEDASGGADGLFPGTEWPGGEAAGDAGTGSSAGSGGEGSGYGSGMAGGGY
ncbi:MAG: hypothetical protein LBQ79_03850 [Deltaproteobacteria bacterium]|nr:hypothetical protein [Deltaproteobacteria bacterium]